MKRYLLTFAMFAICLFAVAQNTTNVHVKGVGLDRDQALKDALRAAVAQAAGVALTAYTTMENYVVIKDAVSTRTEGVVTTYNITKETPLTSTYEVEIDATVSLDAIKQSAAALAQLIGGVRFLVVYDPRDINADMLLLLDYAVERVNEKLKEDKYEYIESGKFSALKEGALKVLANDTSDAAFVQKLGLFSGAQFIVFIKNLSIRRFPEGAPNKTKVDIDIKAYDNCVSEGLGTIVMEGVFSDIPDVTAASKYSINQAVSGNFSRLMMFFNQSIGNWGNNGAPYDLRFFGMGTPRNLIALVEKLRDDPDFGGTIEPIQMPDYVSIRCKFKKTPWDMYTSVIKYADEIPELKAKAIDAKLQYGRQISFAPMDVVVPDAEQLKAATQGKGNNK